MVRTMSRIWSSGGLRRADHDVHAVAEDVQLGVRDQDRDLDQGIRLQVESGHLAVDPHDPVR